VDVIYSDASLLIINKPAGMPVLPDGWDPDAPYLVQQLKAEFAELRVVHRLDKVTSGVMVFARTAEAHRSLNLQFERHEIQKKYHGLCYGIPKWEEHTARHPLRINVGHSHRTVVDHAKGKPSETHFRVLEKHGQYALLEVEPATGRTHQVRVHAYALGHPLLGDILYSAPPTEFIDRPALHALSLMLAHPATGQVMTFEAPYPDDFERAIRLLQENKQGEEM
jgi:tRNA pseudouridine32 synthase/23S rRNA pseudouridine746 synthase